jgi:hypothetical protein
MALIPIDGNVKVAYVATIASIAAPAAATELNAGTSITDLAQRLTPDGLNMNRTEDTKDRSTLASTFNVVAPGRAGGTVVLKYYRDTVVGSDKPYATLKDGTLGYLVIRRGPTEATAFAAADKLEVYPIVCGKQLPTDPAKNSDSQVQQTLYLGAWNIDAVAAT